jgi:methionyl-tRNA formyltransferase
MQTRRPEGGADLDNDATMKKVLLLGMGPTALSALESLARRFDVIGIVRSVKVGAEADDVVVRRAQQLSVPVLTDTGLEGVQQALEELQPHCTVVSSYDRVLGPRILSHGRFVNVHYAALPKYRGRANVNWAILNHESETAITIHAITSGLDNGNILFQKAIPIGQDNTVTDIYGTLNEIQRNVLGDTVVRYLDGFAGVPQDESESTYGCARVPADGEIDWSNSTDDIYALIRALSPPYPGAHSYLEARRITIVRASPVREGPRYVGRVPGRVVGRSRSDGHVDVLTGDGTIRLHEVITDEDGEAAPASGVITSTRQTLGLRSADLLMRIKDLERRLSGLLTEGK